jgi:hypothetical protein
VLWLSAHSALTINKMPTRLGGEFFLKRREITAFVNIRDSL